MPYKTTLNPSMITALQSGSPTNTQTKSRFSAKLDALNDVLYRALSAHFEIKF